AINPSKPCGHCKYCLQHEENHCTEMRFFGSAMYFPHVDGGFTFHRVIPGFMIQGGGFNEQMQQKKPNPPIKNEADNGLRNTRG
ncbi:alcohol dehydrogenase catalytic domain-containing protein, partial [Salmonella enterica subsp. enterica serovar Montevideo]|nr:alcohol dehydrogenase catalytic domain-containing protein [Salmonella enterica subsp. enterica serovar Montevideo]